MTTTYADGKMLAEVSEGVGLITFNQPEKRNAMSVAMWHGLSEILDAFEADEAIRTVVMTGAGTKAFVSGADISQFESTRADGNAQLEYDRLTGAGQPDAPARPDLDTPCRPTCASPVRARSSAFPRRSSASPIVSRWWSG